MKIMAVSPPNRISGKKELIKYIKIAEEGKVDLLLLPSSFLPYYLNSTATYTGENIRELPSLLAEESLLVIVGVNELSYGKLFKTTVAFNKQGIVNIHRKHDLEMHYVEKGFSAGTEDDFTFSYKNIKINPLECFEVLNSKNWEGANLVTSSVGFGMKAVTDNYDCDYFEQWLSIVKANCLQNNCWCMLSCNAQHHDIMTVVVNQYGEVIAMCKTEGYFICEVSVDPSVIDLSKNPLRETTSS